MRLPLSALTTLALATATLVSGALLNLPTLTTCEPADIRVLAKGNYTVEARDSVSHRLYFRKRIRKGVSLVTWSAVDLPLNSTAIVTVTDQIGSAATATSVVTDTAQVLPNPTGDVSCLKEADRHPSNNGTGNITSLNNPNSNSSNSTDANIDSENADRNHDDRHRKQKSMIPTIIGIVVGAFLLLIVLLVGGMIWRRQKEKGEKIESDSVDLHDAPQGAVPAGGSYMARLVPGLKLTEARPLPRDPVLEGEQEAYANTRRGTMYYKTNPNNPGGVAVDGLPGSPGSQYSTVTQGQQQAQRYNPPQHSPYSSNQPYGTSQHTYVTNPFASNPDIHRYQPSPPPTQGQNQQQHWQTNPNQPR